MNEAISFADRDDYGRTIGYLDAIDTATDRWIELPDNWLDLEFSDTETAESRLWERKEKARERRERLLASKEKRRYERYYNLQ